MSLDLNDGKSEDTKCTRTDLYHERQTLSAGIAAFATKDIPSGTRLFCEEALLVVLDATRQLELFDAVMALSKEKQIEFWALAASSKPSKDLAWIDELRSSSHESTTFDALVAAHEQAWSIYETNRFTVRFPNGDRKLGIFLKSSRLNHSCAPNVFHRYNARIDRLTVHALRDIQPGEELNTSYIDICHPTVMRRQMLRSWGFRCRCSACDSQDDEDDSRRKRWADIIKKARKYEQQRKSNCKSWTEREYGRSLGVIRRGIETMEKEGMEESDTLGFLLSLAIKYGLNISREDATLAMADRLLVVERKCLGEDSNEFDDAVKLRQAVKDARKAMGPS
ncbi:hypothetical protein BJ170DRAFT_420717 [Xylariales sp. AK1849]|nr:hypothetical protein BJ170DRAFT_420717 [Xylariales sp. AK1849]